MYYFTYLDIEKIMTEVTETGRAAHVIRNYVQGFVNLNNPVFLTIDNISGQIEAKVREIKSLIHIKSEIKQKLASILISTKFLKKICLPNFINPKKKKQLKDLNIEKIQNNLTIIETNIKNIDISINNSILTKSEELYSQKIPKIPFFPLDENLQKKLRSNFICEKYIKNTDFKSRQKKEIFKENIKNLSEYLSNKAHLIQDELSQFQKIEKKDKIAKINKIINLSGQIENKSRESLKMLICNENNFKLGYRNKNLVEILNFLKEITKIFGGDEFFKEKKEDLQSLVGCCEKLCKGLKEVYCAGFVEAV